MLIIIIQYFCDGNLFVNVSNVDNVIKITFIRSGAGGQAKNSAMGGAVLNCFLTWTPSAGFG